MRVSDDLQLRIYFAGLQSSYDMFIQEIQSLPIIDFVGFACTGLYARYN